MRKISASEKRLREAVRRDLKAELAMAAKDPAVVGRDEGDRERLHACHKMERDEQMLHVLLLADEMASWAQLSSGNLSALADGAAKDAEEVLSVIATAATSVKQAVGAMEILTKKVHGVTATTQANDWRDTLNMKALAARNAANKALTATDGLKGSSLEASIEASLEQSSAVAQTFSLVSDQIGVVAADATSVRNAIFQALLATVKDTNLVRIRHHGPRLPLEKALMGDEGLTKSTLGLDDQNEQTVRKITAQTEAADKKIPMIQAVVDALGKRQAAIEILLSDAKNDASTASKLFTDGELATQTVLNGIAKAYSAHQQAQKTHSSIRKVVKHAHAAVQKAVVATQAMGDFVASINSRRAKSELISDNVVSQTTDMQADTQPALSAVRAALQDSKLALAGAEKAVISSAAVLRGASPLLERLLPQAMPIPGDAVVVTNHKKYPLYSESPPSIRKLAAATQKKGDRAKGLLYWLDAVKDVTEFTKTEMDRYYTQVSLELNSAQHELDEATQLAKTLQAAMNAANTVIS